MRIKTKDITKLLLFFTLFGLEDFACLVPSSNYIANSFLKFSDIGIILAIFWTLWVLFFVRKQTKEKNKYRYGLFIFAFFIIIIISSFCANYFFSQSVFIGIRSMRKIIICLILYFPILKCLQNNIITKNELLKYIYIISFFELTIYILQFLLVNKITFVYIDTGEFRYDSVRLRFPYLFPLISGFISLDNILSSKKSRFIDFYYTIGSFVLVAGICKYRAPSLILLVIFIIGFIIWKKGIDKKIFIGFLIFGCLSFYLANSNIVQSSLRVFEKKETISKDNTLMIREDGQKYYLEKLKKSPVFGFGLPNLNNRSAMIASGSLKYYYLADNGIIGFIYIHGLIGAVWVLFLFKKVIKDSYMIYVKNESMRYLLYFMFEILNLYIGMHWYYYYPLPFVLMLILLDYEVVDVERKCKYERER